MKKKIMMVATVIMEATTPTVKFIAVTAVWINSKHRYMSSADVCRYVCE